MVSIGRQATACQCLTKCQRGHLRILRSPCPCQVRHQLRVEGLAASHEFRVVTLGRPEKIVGGRPVSPPVRPQLPAKKLLGVNLVVGDHEMAGDGFGMDRSHVKNKRQAGRLIIGGSRHSWVVAIRNVASIDKLIAQ